MENITKLIQMAFAAIVFCISIACVFFETKTYNTALATVRELYKDDDVVYMQYNPDVSVTVSYSELIAILMQPLEYDLLVDSYRIYKITHTADQISLYGIQRSEYIKSYHYNANGEIDLIIYTKVN